MSHSGPSHYQVYRVDNFQSSETYKFATLQYLFTLHVSIQKNHPQRRTVTIRKHCRIRWFWQYAFKLWIMLTIQIFVIITISFDVWLNHSRRSFPKCRSRYDAASPKWNLRGILVGISHCTQYDVHPFTQWLPNAFKFVLTFR